MNDRSAMHCHLHGNYRCAKCFSVDGWDRSVQYVQQLEAQLAGALEVISAAHDALCDAPEINPSNYDHEQVCRLNREASYAHSILHSALAGQAGEG